jgi:hypothetical protein
MGKSAWYAKRAMKDAAYLDAIKITTLLDCTSAGIKSGWGSAGGE